MPHIQYNKIAVSSKVQKKNSYSLCMAKKKTYTPKLLSIRHKGNISTVRYGVS